ncbi:hypothetical protein ACH5RR_036449 [Cinchona calisaya]|uniref:Uncharacterized protein n=1 Tax=Cinchona calisaya TaxID=153742 RepID=A0ABD2Y859_9GENT
MVILKFVGLTWSGSQTEATRVRRKLLEGGAAGVGADVFVVPWTENDCLYAYKIFFGLDKGHCLLQGSTAAYCEPL